MLTDVQGLYRDWPTSEEVIASLTGNELRDLLPTLASGMLPKMEACLRSVDAGVSRAHVIDGRVRHSLTKLKHHLVQIPPFVVRGEVEGERHKRGLHHRLAGL
mgnify:CR=1 FL=1